MSLIDYLRSAPDHNLPKYCFKIVAHRILGAEEKRELPSEISLFLSTNTKSLTSTDGNHIRKVLRH